MKDKVTETFTFVSFPKPVKKDRGFKRYGIPIRNESRIAKKLIVRHSKAGKHKKRSILPSIKSLKRKADSLFSKFIIVRDRKCVLCHSTISLTNGHLIKRGVMATRYHEQNCNCLCAKCNFKGLEVQKLSRQICFVVYRQVWT